MIANEMWAWREFQRRYDRLIHRCITKVTSGASPPSSEPTTSATSTRRFTSRSWRAIATSSGRPTRPAEPLLEPGSAFSRSTCAYDYLRSLKREPQKGPLAEAAELACELPDPYENAVESQRAMIAARVLDAFSEKDQTFAALYFGEELDPVEIAARMNISVKTVYSKKHKIRVFPTGVGAERRERLRAGPEKPPPDRASAVPVRLLL